MARRQISVFSVSFLDCMCCGFGAIILLFMIISARIDQESDLKLEDLSADQTVLETRVLAGERHLAAVRASVVGALEQQVKSDAQRVSLLERFAAVRGALQREAAGNSAARAALEAQKDRLKGLEDSKQSAEESADEAGSRLREIVAEGDRQYLTGMRMGGRRILIVVDTSTSMLASTLVNVVLRRHLPDEQQLAADKWRRAVETVDWLAANIPPASDFQIFAFNESAESIVENSGGDWVPAGDGRALDAAVKRLALTVPSGGTSLHAAFDAIKGMSPRPDNVFLIVDGLPTRGAGPPKGRTVTGSERLSHFERALRRLPRGVPLNVILFPMEGDPKAAPVYWELARSTRGSFMSPSKDWP